MIDVKNPKDCCGCTACASICPHDAIAMLPDALGFLYPKIDESKCVECGLCDKVCAFNSHYDISDNLDQPLAFAARHLDKKHLNTSRSGGAFIALSDYILEQGGVVYGAGWGDDFVVIHKRATNKEERDEFKGSKYTQSNLTGIFRQVRQDLCSGKKVLFSGTGCQVAGLKSYIGKKQKDNLFLVDIVCHGVPSPYLWSDYLHFVEKKEHKKIIVVNFRDKAEKGWKAHYESFTFDDGTKKYTSLFRELFFAHINLRYSCYNCHYCNLKRTGDVSLADYWGWERTNSEFNADDKGCSLVLCNTEKGKVIFEAAKISLNTIQADLINITQPRLNEPSPMSPLRMNFEDNYVKYGFEYAVTHSGFMGWRYDLKCLKQKIRNRLIRLKRTIYK